MRNIFKKINKKKIIIILISILAVGISFYSASILLSKKSDTKIDINKILKEKDYSYLPKEAKEYIESVYKTKGTLLLTEKNKKKNEPYLNPRYVNYLTSSLSEKENTELIPNPTLIERSNYGSVPTEELPSKFDLRNVDGKNYVTPVENQGKLDLCWAFASLSQAESYLLVKNNQGFDPNTSKIFSKRQLDYVSAENGIKGYTLDSDRMLGKGGNYNNFMDAADKRLTFVSKDNFKEYNDEDNEKEEMYKVMNYNNSEFEVEETVNMSYDFFKNDEEKENYVKSLKTYIKTYGGAYVGTSSPNSGCSSYDSQNDTYLILDDNSCKYSAHAMHIIGWDDDYSYSYCNNDGVHEQLTSSCDSENKVEGKGAWLLKNSWGNNASYVYLAYDSSHSDVNIITKLNDKKDWDISNKYFRDKGDKVKKVKFYSYKTGEYKIKGNSKSNVIKTVNIDKIGYNTVDLNYTLDSGDEVEVYNGDEKYCDSDMYIETKDKLPFADTYEYRYTDNLYSTDYDYTFYLFSETVNIASNEKLDYKLYDSMINDLSDKLSYEENYVAADAANTLMHISADIQLGKYIIETLYNGKSLDMTEITIDTTLNKLEGLGTKENPYLIRTENDLYKINRNMDAYYSLQNDISILNRTFISIGYENKQAFTGVLDGNNHTINAEISREKHEYLMPPQSSYYDSYKKIGLFSEIGLSNNHDTIIKNLNLEIQLSDDYSLNNHYIAGALTGYLNANSNLDNSNKILIENISFDADSYSSGVISGLIGLLEYNKNNVYINNIFMKGEMNYVTSNSFLLIDSIVNTDTQNNPNARVNISNIEVLNSNNSHSCLIEELKGIINLENVLFFYNGSSDLNEFPYMDIISLSYNIENATEKSNLKNIYYSNYDNSHLFHEYDNFNIENVEKKNIFDLTDKKIYDNWDSFDENWIIKTIDGVPRIPILKHANYDYVNVPKEISIKNNDKYYLDYEVPYWSAFKFEIENNEIISIGGYYPNEIKGLSIGKTRLHITNTWDGYDNYVNVNVNASYSIKYKSKLFSWDKEYYYEVGKKEKLKKYNDVFLEGDGYKFIGWNTKADGTGITYMEEEEVEDLVSENERITLYAILSPIIYTVKFDSNSGTGKMDNMKLTYDISYKLNKNTFEKEGYNFKKWNTKIDGTGINYKDEEKVNNMVRKENEEITLFAQWSPINYIVKFDSNGGTGKMDGMEFTYDASSKLNKNVFEKDGYKFKEWNTKFDGTGISYKDEEKVKNLTNKENEEVILYAIWEFDGVDIKDYKKDNNELSNIKPLTTLAKYKENVKAAGSYKIKVFDKNDKELSNDDLIFTGSITKIYKDDIVVEEYANIVKGDIDGDGEATTADAYDIVLYSIGKKELKGIYFKAGLIDSDEEVTTADAYDIVLYSLGKKGNL